MTNSILLQRIRSPETKAIARARHEGLRGRLHTMSSPCDSGWLVEAIRRERAARPWAERVARRMAKKKVRASVGLKEKGDKEGKKRVRERKSVEGRKSDGKKNAGVKTQKGRVRSEKSLLKRNAKK